MKEIRLTIKEADWEALRTNLLKDDGLERQAFMELGLSDKSATVELFVHRLRTIEDHDYESQQAYYVRPKSKEVLKAYSSFCQSGVLVQGHIHSHPFCDKAAFSGVDGRTRKDMVKGLRQLVQTSQMDVQPMCFQMVTGRTSSGFEGVLVDLAGREIGRLASVRVLGERGIQDHNRRSHELTPYLHNDQRLDRNIRWLGEAGQENLSQTHLAVCGLGGAGAMIVANIRGMGFGEITLVDPDRVEPSNLNRLSGAGRADVGSCKVDVFRREILRVFPETPVHAYPCGVEDPQALAALSDADLIIAAVDGMKARAELQVLAARAMKPLFDLGSGILLNGEGTVSRMGSQIIVYVPGGPCLACQGLDLFRPTEGLPGEVRRRTGYVVDTDFTPASAATINSVAAGWSVDLLIRYLTGQGPIPHYTSIDQWTGKISQLPFISKDQCPICGKQGLEGKGDNQVDLLPPPDETAGFHIESVSKEPFVC